MKIKHLLLSGLVLLIGACATPLQSTPAPTPEAIYITYPPALQAWLDALAGCASGNPLMSIYITPSDELPASLRSDEIVLALGQPVKMSTDDVLSQVGWEQVVVIVNQQNPLSQLSTNELVSTFSANPSLTIDKTQPLQVWVLPEDEPTAVIFTQNTIQDHTVTSEAMLAPDPSAMLEAIAGDKNAIGYLPATFLKASDPSVSKEVKIIQLDTELEVRLRQPVIALTLGDPQGLLRGLLACLETKTP